MELYYGVVEDRQDPEMMGRVKVRVTGIHSPNKQELPTEDLPWSMTMTPVTSPSVSGVGASPHIVEGSWVVVSFLDEFKQNLLVLGTIPGYPIEKRSGSVGFSDPNEQFPRYTNESDINKRARGENTTPKSSSAGEPGDPFAAQYPHNHVIETESGHIVEYDDTPGAERINIQHKTGSFVEIHPNGDMWIRSADHFNACNNMTINIVDDAQVNIGGNANIGVVNNAVVGVGGTTNISSKGEMRISSSADIFMKGSNIHLNPSFGFPEPALISPSVEFSANVIEISPADVPAGYPANVEQVEGEDVVYEEQSPTNCGDVEQQNPYDAASTALSLGEANWKENGSNPNITALWDEIGYNGSQYADETAWCAVFVGACLKRSGNKFIQTASSQAYANYGIEVDPADVQQGDIVVFYRKSPNSGLGHVGFATGNFTDTTIEVLGGNQSNTLKVSTYSTVNTDKWGLRTIRRAVSCEDGTTEAPAATTEAGESTPDSGQVT